MSSGSFVGKIFKSDGFQKYLKNTTWMLGEKVGTLAVSFLVSVYVFRYLGEANVGILGYTQAVGTFFVILSALGLDKIVTRNIVSHPEDTNKILGTAFILKLATALAGLVLVLPIVLIAVGANQVESIMMGIIVATTIFHSMKVIDFYYNSQVMSRFAVRMRLVQFVVITAAKLIFITMGRSVEWFAGVILIGDIVLAAGYLFSYQRLHGNVFQWRFDWGYAKELLKDSWPLVLSGFVIVVYMKMDQVMIKLILQDDAANGIYYTAVRLSEIWYFIPTVIASSLFPAIVNSRSKDYKLYMNRVQSLFDMMVFLSLCLAIPVTLLGDWIIEFLYDGKFQGAGTVLKIHVWASIFVFLGVASTQWLLAENLQRIALYRSILGAFVNIGLNFILIPEFGVKGAAMATLFSQGIASYFGYLLTKKTWIIFRMQSRAFLFWLFFKKENFLNLIQKK